MQLESLQYVFWKFLLQVLSYQMVIAVISFCEFAYCAVFTTFTSVLLLLLVLLLLQRSGRINKSYLVTKVCY